MTQNFNLDDEWEYPYHQYIDANFRVMPLHPIVNFTQCGCGEPDCSAVGKHPINAGWQNTPVWDNDQLIAMREHLNQLHPAVGVLVDGFLIVDVDERNGGVESIARLEKQLDIKLHDLCGFVVQTGSGGASCHYYFKLDTELKLRQNLRDYPGIDFKTSGYVVGWGSPHISGLTYERLKGYPEDAKDAPQALIDVLTIKPSEHGFNAENAEINDLNDILGFINPVECDYHDWVNVGMALHESTGGSIDALELWTQWSLKDAKRYKDGECDRKWHGFGKSTTVVTIGTIVHLAQKNGYTPPVTFSSDIEFNEPEPQTRLSIEALAKNIKPWDIPGFGGKLYSWIDGQCRYPRPTLCAGAVLYALSSIGGMRHLDARDDLPLNLMAFGVAASGTGKENIIQAITRLFSNVGIVQAMHGKIKSEQEIFRNLVEHQLAAYNIDELGIMLQKITTASRAGGAVYLTGVIGAIMEIYSKANGILAITGDLKKEITEVLLRRQAAKIKLLDTGLSEKEEKKVQAELTTIQNALNDAQHGIKAPFLTMFGSTTPSTFDSTITPENAQNGFIARALVLREHEDNPRIRKGFKAEPLDFSITSKLNQLYHGNNADTAPQERIQALGSPVGISTDDKASELLDEVYEYFWELGEVHKEKTGLVGIVRRGWEMASKISLILAMCDGARRTKEHVIYGFAMAKQDVDLKIAYAYSAETNTDDAVIVRLLSRLDKDTGKTRGEVNRLLRGVRMDITIDELLERLITHNRIRTEINKPERGRPTQYYYLV